MAVDDGQDNYISESRALTAKSASSKHSSTNPRSRSRSSSNNANRRGMIPSETQQRAISTLGGDGGMITIALGLTDTRESLSPIISPLPSRTTTATSTTPDPGPSVAAQDAAPRFSRDGTSNDKTNTPNKRADEYTLQNMVYTKSSYKDMPTPSQYSPSIYNTGDDWTKVPSPPLPVPAIPSLPTLAATTYSPRSAKKSQNNPSDTGKSTPKGATPARGQPRNSPSRQVAANNLYYDPELERKPLVAPGLNRQKIDPRDDQYSAATDFINGNPPSARPYPPTVARKKTIREISVPVSPAAAATPGKTTQPKSIQPTRMIKIKTQQVARRQPQVVQVKSPSTAGDGVVGGASSGARNVTTSKVAALARTKSRITRIISFGGTSDLPPSTGAGAGAGPSPDEAGGGGWWDMLDNIILGPLKPPPPAAPVKFPARAMKFPEIKTVSGTTRGGVGKQGVFDPKNLI